MAQSLSAAFLLAASLFRTGAAAGHEMECTKGRLFISDESANVLHVMDLDTMEEVATLSVDKPGLSVLATESDLATIMTRDRSNMETPGKVSFFRPGFTAKDHDGHMHVSKSIPSSVSFSVVGWRPTHITSSEGYISVFMDGDLYGAPPTHNSSAVFVKESEVVASTSGSPATIIEVSIDGAHHGVSYALDDDRFLLTITTEGEVLPDNFIVTDASGTMTHNIGNHDNPSCPDYHGAAHVGHDWLFGCADVGLLSVHYDHGSRDPTWKIIPFPDPVGGSPSYRTGTVRGHEAGGLFAADFRLNAGYNPGPPFYLIPLAAGATTIPVENLVVANRSATERTHCSYMMDRATQDSCSVLLLVLHNDGNLQVVPVSSSGVPGTEMEVKINETLDCGVSTMVTGYGYAYIITGGETPTLHTVDLAEVAEGQTDSAVMRTALNFTPASAALSLPPNVACDVMHGHSCGGTQEASLAVGATFAPLNFAALLFAAAFTAP